MTMSSRKTFDDLLRMDAVVIPGTWCAEAMGMDSTRLIAYARERPELIGYPFQLSGKRMKVARVPFLKFWGLTDEEIKEKKRRK